MITCVVKLKDRPIVEQLEGSTPLSPWYTLTEAAAEVKSTLGKGGNPDAQVIEDYIGHTNCPTLGPYFRASFDEAYAVALQYIKDTGGAETCEIISVEWEGQKMFYVEVDPAIGPEPLGMISNCTVYQEPVEAEE